MLLGFINNYLFDRLVLFCIEKKTSIAIIRRKIDRWREREKEGERKKRKKENVQKATFAIADKRYTMRRLVGA